MMGQYRTEYTIGGESIKYESSYTTLVFPSKLEQRRRKINKILNEKTKISTKTTKR